MYEPPKDMTPAEVGSLLEDSVHPRDITSTLVDLAVRGYLKIEETESKVLLFFASPITSSTRSNGIGVERPGSA